MKLPDVPIDVGPSPSLWTFTIDGQTIQTPAGNIGLVEYSAGDDSIRTPVELQVAINRAQKITKHDLTTDELRVFSFKSLRWVKPRGGKREGARRPTTGRSRRQIWANDYEASQVDDFLERLRNVAPDYPSKITVDFHY